MLARKLSFNGRPTKEGAVSTKNFSKFSSISMLDNMTLNAQQYLKFEIIKLARFISDNSRPEKESCFIGNINSRDHDQSTYQLNIAFCQTHCERPLNLCFKYPLTTKRMCKINLDLKLVPDKIQVWNIRSVSGM